jgi:hypothetical protein
MARRHRPAWSGSNGIERIKIFFSGQLTRQQDQDPTTGWRGLDPVVGFDRPS